MKTLLVFTIFCGIVILTPGATTAPLTDLEAHGTFELEARPAAEERSLRGRAVLEEPGESAGPLRKRRNVEMCFTRTGPRSNGYQPCRKGHRNNKHGYKPPRRYSFGIGRR